MPVRPPTVLQNFYTSSNPCRRPSAFTCLVIFTHLSSSSVAESVTRWVPIHPNWQTRMCRLTDLAMQLQVCLPFGRRMSYVSGYVDVSAAGWLVGWLVACQPLRACLTLGVSQWLCVSRLSPNHSLSVCMSVCLCFCVSVCLSLRLSLRVRETLLTMNLFFFNSNGTGADLPILSNEAMANHWVHVLINHLYLRTFNVQKQRCVQHITTRSEPQKTQKVCNFR